MKRHLSLDRGIPLTEELPMTGGKLNHYFKILLLLYAVNMQRRLWMNDIILNG